MTTPVPNQNMLSSKIIYAAPSSFPLVRSNYPLNNWSMDSRFYGSNYWSQVRIMSMIGQWMFSRGASPLFPRTMQLTSYPPSAYYFNQQLVVYQKLPQPKHVRVGQDFSFFSQHNPWSFFDHGSFGNKVSAFCEHRPVVPYAKIFSSGKPWKPWTPARPVSSSQETSTSDLPNAESRPRAINKK